MKDPNCVEQGEQRTASVRRSAATWRLSMMSEVNEQHDKIGCADAIRQHNSYRDYNPRAFGFIMAHLSALQLMPSVHEKTLSLCFAEAAPSPERINPVKQQG